MNNFRSVVLLVALCLLPTAVEAQDKAADLGIGGSLGFTTPASGLVLGSTVSYQYWKIRFAGQLEWVRKPADEEPDPNSPVAVDCDAYRQQGVCSETFSVGGIEALAIVGRVAAGPGLRWASSEIGGRGTEPYGTVWVHLPLPYFTDDNPHNGLLLRASAGEVYRQVSAGIYVMAWW